MGRKPVSPTGRLALGAAVAAFLGAARLAPAQATRPLTAPPQFALDRWTTADGLPQNSVTALAQTPDGYLWVGTFGGLARFDGATFTRLERRDSAGQHIDRVLSLAVGPDSSLWIGTESGLLNYRHGAFVAYTTADGLPDDEIAVLHVDRAGALWIGAERGGIARYANGRFQVFREVDGVPLDHVVTFVEDPDGTLWVNFGSRFITVEGGAPTAARWRDRAVRREIQLLLRDRAGAHWFSLPDGVARVAGAAVRVLGRREGVPGRPSMVEDPGGGYWLGTTNDGLFFLQPGGDGGLEGATVRRYPLPEGRGNYRIRTALVDREGNVWFGTNANGLLRAKRNVFTTYTAAHGLSHDVITAVFADAGGRVWVGTNCFGVNAVDPEHHTVRVFKPRRSGDPAGDPCVFALTEAPRGTVWVGTWGGGLTRITGSRVERLPKSMLRDSVILALFTDRDGAVWVGTNTGGLAELRDGRVRASYTAADGLAHNSVRTIYQTRDGALWIGTLGGLSRLLNGRLRTWTAVDGLSAEHVRAIYEDRDGDLWIGTYGGGLNRLHDGVFTPITQQDGLAEDVVSAILEDGDGRFWLSGNRGISRVARADLVTFTEGRMRRVRTVLYGRTDGLLSAETNGGFQPAGVRDARGRFWFPTVRGVAVVDPQRVQVVTQPPAVTVSEIDVDGVPRTPTARLEVGPGRPNLEFYYAGLSLTAPEHLTFRYRLVGFDPDWVEAGARRVAYYPRLPPGSYTFTVMAANRDEVWSAAAAVQRVRVTAPFWSAWWFRSAAALAVLGLAAALLHRREVAARRWGAAQEQLARQLIEGQEHERRRIAGELHDGLGQELLVVKNRALLALQADGITGPAREQVQHIHDVVTQSLESVRGLAHNLVPYQLEHLGLTAALQAMVESVAGTLPLAIDATIEDVDGLLGAEQQINLYRIVQEALSNVVRHSGASSAAVHVRRAGDAVAVTISDDGRGFDTRRESGGFGMLSIAERARMLGARVAVASAPGAGTRIGLLVPLNASAPGRER